MVIGIYWELVVILFGCFIYLNSLVRYNLNDIMLDILFRNIVISVIRCIIDKLFVIN